MPKTFEISQSVKNFPQSGHTALNPPHILWSDLNAFCKIALHNAAAAAAAADKTHFCLQKVLPWKNSENLKKIRKIKMYYRLPIDR